MRQLILAVMIVLLPLRGWVSEAMATEMAFSVAVHLQTATHPTTTHPTTTHLAASHAGGDHSHPAESAFFAPDCAGHSGTEQTPQDNAHCATCAACQACHTVALLTPAVTSVALLSRPAQPYSPAVAFASALVALSQKPPIS